MAYASSRSSRGPAPRRGGGGNPAAMAIAAVLVLGVIVGIIVMSSGGPAKPEPKKAPPVPAAPPVAPPPVVPSAPAYPSMPPAKVDEANALVRKFPERGAQAQKLYEESQQAKVAGNEAEWQSKLREARGLLDGINDEWNEFLATLPTNKDYDQEQVAAYYFRVQNGEVAKWTKLLRVMKSDER